MKVLKDYIILSCSEGEEKKTESGIILSSEVQEIDDSTEETVLDVGADVKDTKKGDKVLFKRHLFQQYLTGGKNILVGKEEGIIAIL